jgi:hypothetical protein
MPWRGAWVVFRMLAVALFAPNSDCSQCARLVGCASDNRSSHPLTALVQPAKQSECIRSAPPRLSLLSSTMPYRMMVQSFIGSQKFTVQQTLERKFSRYLTLPQDYHSLLMSLLRQALRSTQREQALGGDRPGSQVKIPCRCDD